MVKNQQFQGRIALVTGAGGGIGRALVRRLHALGYTLALVGRTEEKLRAAAQGCGEDTLLIVGDLADANFVQSVVGKAVSHFGRLDLLVNNAGIVFVQNMEDTSYDRLDAMMRTNVYAPYILCRDAVAPLRKSDCAAIVNIGSVVSHKGYATQSAYAAAKHALLGMSKALAAEVYRDGIRVHMISPGAVNTEMARAISRPDIDMNALISTEDIADTMEFLLTHRSNAVIDEIEIHRVGKQPFI